MTNKEIIVTNPRFTLSLPILAKWFSNQKTFLAPLAIFYLVFVIAQVGQDGVAPADFIPSNAVVSAMVLYLLNALYDLLRKWAGKNEYIIPVK